MAAPYGGGTERATQFGSPNEVASDELLADALQTISCWQADPVTCTRACDPDTRPQLQNPDDPTTRW